MPSSKKIEDRRRTYVKFMREIKLRQVLITQTLRGRMPVAAFMAFENCYLQLRMICEVIALGCLAVHGDMPETKTSKMQKAYEADWILKALDRLHPKFFPVPCTVKEDEGSFTKLHVDPNRTDYMTKQDLLTLYAECGGVLHRGRLDRLRTGSHDNFEIVRVHNDKIVRLLQYHFIQFANPDSGFFVRMVSEKHRGEVHGVQLEASPAISPSNDYYAVEGVQRDDNGPSKIS